MMNVKKRLIGLISFVLIIYNVKAQSIYPGQHEGKMKMEVKAPMQVQSFDLKDVRLLPSRFRENMERDSAWMVSISVDVGIRLDVCFDGK